jgi:HSP20 family protein
VVTVSGEREAKGEGDRTWFRKERFDGPFRRVINLPDDVAADRIRARYQDGVLRVTAERPESKKPRKIEIN